MKEKWFASIKGALNKSYLLLIVIFILIVALLLGISINRVIQENLKQQNINLAYSVRNNVNLFLQETENNLQMLKDNLKAVSDSERRLDTNQLLSTLLDNYPRMEKVRVLDSEGVVEFVQPYSRSEVGINLSQESFLSKREQEGIYWSSSFLSTNSGEPAIYVSLPLEEGYLVVNLDVSQFNQMLAEMESDPKIIIYDEKGTAIASTTREHAYYRENHSNQNHVVQALNGEEITERIWCTINEQEMLASSIPMANNWVITTSKPLTEAYEIIYTMLKILVLTGGLIFATGYLFSHIFSEKIAGPVEELTAGARSLVEGNYSRLETDSKFEELRILKDSFNEMTDIIAKREKRLKQNQQELKASYGQLAAYTRKIGDINEDLEQSYKKINMQNERFRRMVELISNLRPSSEVKEEKFLANILHNAVAIVPEADYGLICVLDDDKCNFIDAVGHNSKLLQQLKVDKDAVFVEDKQEFSVSEDYCFDLDKFLSEEKETFLQALKPISKSIFMDIVVDFQIEGRIFLDISAKSSRDFSEITEKILDSFTILASSFFSFQRYNKLQGQFNRELIGSIITILEMYDTYTSGHSENVAEMAARIAEMMGLSSREIKDAYWAGMVHDIGKLLIPLQVLNKPGKLTEEEFELIENHPYWGYMALSKSSSLEHIAEYVLYHHERWDGRGYPEGIQGEEIPLIAQILAVADAWDAMTSKRSYREPLSKEKAYQELKTNKGTQFSPVVIDIFKNLLFSIG